MRDCSEVMESVMIKDGCSSLRLTGNEGSNQGLFWPHIELSLFCLHCEIMCASNESTYKKLVFLFSFSSYHDL